MSLAILSGCSSDTSAPDEVSSSRLEESSSSAIVISDGSSDSNNGDMPSSSSVATTVFCLVQSTGICSDMPSDQCKTLVDNGVAKVVESCNFSSSSTDVPINPVNEFLSNQEVVRSNFEFLNAYTDKNTGKVIAYYKSGSIGHQLIAVGDFFEFSGISALTNTYTISSVTEIGISSTITNSTQTEYSSSTSTSTTWKLEPEIKVKEIFSVKIGSWTKDNSDSEEWIKTNFSSYENMTSIKTAITTTTERKYTLDPDYPGWYIYGAFGFVDYYVEVVIDPNSKKIEEINEYYGIANATTIYTALEYSPTSPIDKEGNFIVNNGKKLNINVDVDVEAVLAVADTGTPPPPPPPSSSSAFTIIDNLMIQKIDVGQKTRNDANVECSNSTIGGYDDWRLPSIAELQVMRKNKTVIGGFSSTSLYWSSETGSYTKCENDTWGGVTIETCSTENGYKLLDFRDVASDEKDNTNVDPSTYIQTSSTDTYNTRCIRNTGSWWIMPTKTTNNPL